MTHQQRQDRIYVGKAKYITFRDGGEKCRIWLTPEGVESINANVDRNGSINLVMVQMRDPDKAGNTHTIYVDDWKPAGDSSRQSHAPQRRQRDTSDGDSRRYPNRDRGETENYRQNTRNDGGFGSGGGSEHRYSEEYRNPVDDSDIEDDIPF